MYREHPDKRAKAPDWMIDKRNTSTNEIQPYRTACGETGSTSPPAIELFSTAYADSLV
jgi:hypothetical protein